MSLGTINGLTLQPEKHKYLRVENEEITIIGTQEYTDIFVYNNGTLKFGNVEALYNLHTLFVAKDSSIGNSIGVEHVNIVGDGFSQVDLPYVATENMHLVGYTSDNLPMFAQDATYFKQSGGTITGEVNMDNHKITSLATPTVNTDATTKKYVDDKISGLKSGFNFKGDVASPTQLPTSGNVAGDLYYVRDKQTWYAWVVNSQYPEGRWDDFGPTIDLTPYLKIADLAGSTGNATNTSMTQKATTDAIEAAKTSANEYTDTKTAIATGTTKGTVNPISKTSDMTQNVGVDSEGKLYTLPDTKINVVQNTGTSTTDVMSQNAVNTALNTKVNIDGPQTINGEKTFTSDVISNTFKGNTPGTPVRLFHEDVVQLQAGSTDIWVDNSSATMYPGTTDATDLGKADNKFKDLHLSGNINDVPSTELQRKSNLLRIQIAENTFQDLSDDTYTDIFAYQGGVLFKAGFTGKQIKTFYIEEGFKLKNDTNGPVPKINVDFAEQSLGGEGWTADSKMYLVGYTTDACPLFRRGIHIPTPSVEAANKVITVDAEGKYVLDVGTYVLPQADNVNLGGVRADTKQADDTQPVRIDPTTGKLVTKPGAGSYTLPQADTNTLGGIKADPVTENDTLAIKINSTSGKLYTTPYTLPIVNTSGNSTTSVMSQNAVTTELDNKVSLTGNQTINGEKTFMESVKSNSFEGREASTPLRVFSQGAIQFQAGTAEVWIDNSDKALYPGTNGQTDLGRTTTTFRNLYLSGNINDIPVDQIQRDSNVKRLDTEGTVFDLDTDDYTDIFAYKGTIIFKPGFTGKQIKTFYIENGFTLKNAADGLVPKINVDFVEQDLSGNGWVVDSKMYLVGYTTESCPLFHRGFLIPNPTTADNNKVIKVDATGNYILGEDPYILPQSTEGSLGGVKAATKSTEYTEEVKIDATSGKLFTKPITPYTLPLVQTTGTSTTDVMSQKAVTDELNDKLSLTGGTMIGAINTTAPVITTNVTNKEYVDSKVTSTLPYATSLTISNAGWILDDSTQEYQLDISIPQVHSYDRVELDLSNAELRKAQQNGFLPRFDVLDGKIKLYAKGQPTQEIVGTYWIEKGVQWDPTFANNTPEQISAAAKAGQAKNIWHVGDRYNISLNGTVGAQTFTNNSSYDAFIIGFDHNEAIEGSNTIHMQFAKKHDDGKDIAFVDSNYGSSGLTPAYRMNTTNTNTGGWEASYMRNTICSQFLAALPTEWQAIITDCPKWTNNLGANATPEAVTETQDKIFLLSAPEVIRPAPSWCNPEESNKTTQYAYYANNNVNAQRIKYKSSDPAAACNWWLRSPNTNRADDFCYVYTDGSMNSSDANYSEGFAPGFKVS